MKQVWVLVIVICANSVSGQNKFPPEYTQEFYETVIAKTDSLFTDYGYANPGSAVVIVHNGEVILRKGYGLAVLENKIPISPETIFDIASVSKMFTGYAIASLLYEKRISLSDDVRVYIPELPDYGSSITIDHLVHHTSGLKNWTEYLPIAGFSFDDVIRTDQVLKFTYRQKDLNFLPGEKYEYSNTGYVLLAEIVARVTGMPMQEWCAKNIFEPLAMTNSFILEDHTRIVPLKAASYFTGRDGAWHRSPASCSVVGSSSVHASADDLSRWLMFLDQPGDKKQIVDLMFIPGKLNNGNSVAYGLGVILKTFMNSSVKRHEGFWPSFASFAFLYPELHLAIGVLNNSPLQSYKAIDEIALMFVSQGSMPKDLDHKIEGPHALYPQAGAVKNFGGVYRGGPGWYLTIAGDSAMLTAQVINDDAYPMIVVSDSTYYIPEFHENIVFRKHRNNISILFMGKLLPKIEPKKLNEYELRAMPGRYCNDELETCYAVEMGKSKLTLRHTHLGSLQLVPGFNYDFTILGGERWFPDALEFRSALGKIESFVLGNYHFKKQ